MTEYPRSLGDGDDMFLHQVAAPFGVVGTDQKWGERSFFSIPMGEDAILEMGLRAYPQRGVIEGYAAARVGGDQWNLRTADAFHVGTLDDISANLIRSEIAKPMKEWRLLVDGAEHGIEVDLVCEARTSPFLCSPLKVERDGEVLVHNLTFFQSCHYTGHVKVGTHNFDLEKRAGARDRSWGHRKRESAPARGLMSWIAVERPNGAVIGWVYEKADGTRTYTDGAWLDPDGGVKEVAAVEHDYEFDSSSGLLTGGEILIDEVSLKFDVNTTLHMSGAGHAEGEERTGGLEPGYVNGERWSLTNPAESRVRRAVDDSLANFSLDGEGGYGIVEVARGAHAKYGEPPHA